MSGDKLSCEALDLITSPGAIPVMTLRGISDASSRVEMTWRRRLRVRARGADRAAVEIEVAEGLARSPIPS